MLVRGVMVLADRWEVTRDLKMVRRMLDDEGYDRAEIAESVEDILASLQAAMAFYGDQGYRDGTDS